MRESPHDKPRLLVRMEAESLYRVGLDVHGLRERDVGIDGPGVAHLHLGQREVVHLAELPGATRVSEARACGPRRRLRGTRRG